MTIALLRGIKKFFLAGVFALLICMTLKSAVAQSVSLDWAKSFGGAGSANLWGASIATDALGNVYTVGNLSLTADFDPGTGTANLTSAGGSDLFVSKLDASGNFVWAFRIGGTGGETGEGMVADASGNLYITGSFSSTVDFDPGAGTTNLVSSGSIDIYILKLNSSGAFQWAQKIGGTGNDYGNSITLDPSGNVLLTGLFENTVDFDPGAGTTNLVSKGVGDIFVTKFDASGAFVWAKSIGGSTGTDLGNDIKTDAAGNVFTTGSFSGTVDFDPGAGTNDLTANTSGCTFVLKLNADGTFGWAKHFSGVLYNEGNAITVDNNNNVIVAGLFDGTADFDPGAGVFNQTEAGSDDFFICKLDASGSFVWAHGFGGIEQDMAIGITVDDAGNCYTTGHFASTVDFDPGSAASNLSSSPSNALDIYILKLDASGNFVWVGQMGGVSDQEMGNAITRDAGGNIYTTGNFYGTADFDPNSGTSNLTATGTGRNVFIQKLKLSPTIISFTPSSGTVGTTVTISGTNFDPTSTNNTVEFNGTTALVSASTTSSITTTVPIGATTGLITVTNSSGTATSSSSFNVTVFSITQQPLNPNNRCEGSSITFSTDATGTTNIAYQWQKLNTSTSLFEDISDGGAYSGTNTKNLLISNIQMTEAGDYRCEISGDFVSTVYCNTAILTVNTTPSVPTITNASRCGTGSVTLNASGTTDGNYIWYGSNGMSEPLSGENNSVYVTPSLTSTTDYYVSIVNAFCESSLVQVTATINSVPGAPSASNASRCGSGSATLTASGGANGDYRWYTVASGGVAIVGETNSTYTTPNLTGNTTFYVALNNINCESSRTAVTVSINPIPSDPAITTASRCGNGAVTLGAAGASNGQYRWYTQSTGGSAIAGEVNSTYTTPSLSNTTPYYVSIDNGTCESARTSVTATINSLPTAPTTTGASRCGNGAVSLSAAGGSNGQYRWYTQSAGGASIIGEVNDTYTTPVLSSTTTYYVSIDNGTCESARTSITATINALPSAPTTTGASRCGNGAVTLSAAGGSNGQYRWYTQSTGGAAITSEVNDTYTTPTLTNNKDYYVSINNGLCEGSRTLVTATVNAIPVSPSVTSISRCGSGAVTLKASGGANGQYRWYTQSTGGAPIAGEVNDSFTTPSLASTTTFYTTLTSSACESPRIPVDAIVFPLPAKPVIDPSGGLVVCSGKTRVLTSSPAATYSWSNGAITQQITIGSAGSYTVITTDNNGCVSVASDPVTITLQDCSNNRPPAIQSESATTQVGGSVMFDVLRLLSDPDNNLDLSTLRIVAQPISGAYATITNGNLLIDYKGVSFSGTDRIRIEVCDIAGSCAQQDILIEVAGDITVYNAVSPNGDGKNEVFVIQYIDLLPQTVKNKVTIYNRWGDEVFSITDYDNVERVFAGDGNDGRKLPTGTYFYKIVFAGGHASQSGYLQLNY